VREGIIGFFGGGLGVPVGQTWEEGKVKDIIGKSLEEQDEALY